jgi:predicted dehydrogenase
LHPVRLITLDPGHFHAALVQKESYPQVAPRVEVYAPLGPDLIAHLGRLAAFNSRRDHPTAWEVDVHAGPDYFERMLAEKRGNAVILSGRNRRKIDYILAAVDAGLHVLADKPWIISLDRFGHLENALRIAAGKELIASDIMTERHEITSILQRELVQDADIFGTIQKGSVEEPGVFMESVHYLMKNVAGAPLRRPAWFFDTAEQGEGLADVGTHLVDLVLWMHFPEKGIDIPDIRIQRARRWPTLLSLDDFQRVTGETAFPAPLAAQVQDGRFAYFCNTDVVFRLRGIHVRLKILWDYEAAGGGGDTHFAVCRGSRSRVEVRQRREENHRPELFVVPDRAGDKSAILREVTRKLTELAQRFPGLSAEDRAAEIRVEIPERYRVGHEAHFAAVAREFFAQIQNREEMCLWEASTMQAKYSVTTKGVEMSRTA